MFSKQTLLIFFFLSSITFVWSANRLKAHKQYGKTDKQNGKSCRKVQFKALKNLSCENNTYTAKIQLEENDSICTIDERFLSFTIDSLEMKRHFRCADINSEKVNKLAKALSPAYLRVGGTPQEFATFIDDPSYHDYKQEKESCAPRFENWRVMTEFNISSKTLSQLFNFSKRNNLRLLFGLNARKRNPDLSWNPENAIKIIKFSKAHNLTMDWSLGNEPKRFPNFGLFVSFPQMSKDIKKLRSLVGKDSKIYGPDVGQRRVKDIKFIKDFLKYHSPLDAITYHQYYLPQTETTLHSYLDPRYLNVLEKHMKTFNSVVNSLNSTKSVWLSETGSSSGGGKEILSESYAAGFLYLSKLGLAAQYCHKVVIRQSFYGGYYGMLDAVTKTPLPDYWTSLIFKKLTGTRVLKLSYPKFSFLKLFAFCSKENTRDVIVMYINFHLNQSVNFVMEKFQKNMVEVYILTPIRNKLTSKKMLLNGRRLRFSNFDFEKLTGQEIKQPVVLPKASYGFLKVKNVSFSECVRSG